RAAVTEDVKVTVIALDVPSVRLPKLSVVALKVSCGVVAVPVPLRATVKVGLVVEVLTTVSLPVNAPAVVGAKVTGTTTVWPGVRIMGRVVATIEYPVPETASEVIDTLAVPIEVKVSD